MAKLVVFFPGFMGSRLVRQVSGKDEEVWVAPARLLTLGPGQLRLADNGVDPFPPFRPLVAKGEAWDFYSALRGQLNRADYGTYTAGFDWRKSLRNGLVDQAAEIDAKCEAFTDVYLLSHSMGGLRCRFIWPHLSNATRAKVRCTVYLATPFGGSYGAAQALAGEGQTFDQLDVAYSARRVVLGAVSPLLAGLDSTFGSSFYAMVASWPGLYELLPVPVGAYASLDANASHLYTATNWPELTRPRQDLLDAARATQDALLALGDIPPHESAFFGVDLPTLNGVLDLSQRSWRKSSQGDENVVKERAVPVQGIATVEYGNSPEHSLFPNYQQIVDETINRFNTPTGPTLELSALPQPAQGELFDLKPLVGLGILNKPTADSLIPGNVNRAVDP